MEKHWKNRKEKKKTMLCMLYDEEYSDQHRGGTKQPLQRYIAPQERSRSLGQDSAIISLK